MQLFKGCVISKYFDINKIDKLYQIVDAFDIYRHYVHNPILSEIVKFLTESIAKIHNKMLEDGRGQTAYQVAQNFKLLDSGTPEVIAYDVIQAVENSHFKLLDENNLNGALFLKQNYNLQFDYSSDDASEKITKSSKFFIQSAAKNGETQEINTFIEEYETPSSIVNEALTDAVNHLLRSDQFEIMFKVVGDLDLKIADKDTLGEIITRFHQVYEQNQMDIAADFAYYFKIKEKRAHIATIKYWESLIMQEQFREALAIKKERKIHNRNIERVVKENYGKLMHESKKEEAMKLRNDYKLKYSVFEWIFDNIKKMIGG